MEGHEVNSRLEGVDTALALTARNDLEDWSIIRVNRNGTVVLSDADVERIAQRVVELLKHDN